MSSKPNFQGSLVMLWAGENPALHWVLLERLQAADIPFSDKTLGDDQVALTADPLPIDWKPRFGFEVAVLSLDLPAAKEILEKLLDEDLEDVEIPAQDGAPAEEPPLVVTTEKHPTVEVTTGLLSSLPQRCRRTRFQFAWRTRESKRRFTCQQPTKSGQGKLCTRLSKARRRSKAVTGN
jgi:hypothetical protein